MTRIPKQELRTDSKDKDKLIDNKTNAEDEGKHNLPPKCRKTFPGFCGALLSTQTSNFGFCVWTTHLGSVCGCVLLLSFLKGKGERTKLIE